jgi:hypothetical protein
LSRTTSDTELPMSAPELSRLTTRCRQTGPPSVLGRSPLLSAETLFGLVLCRVVRRLRAVSCGIARAERQTALKRRRRISGSLGEVVFADRASC